MTTPYARLSDLGEIPLTFDQEDEPDHAHDKSRRGKTADPTDEELEMDRRRKPPPKNRKVDRKRSIPRGRSDELEQEQLLDYMDSEGAGGFEDPVGSPTHGPPPGALIGAPAPLGQGPLPSGGWQQIDAALYGNLNSPFVTGLPPLAPKKVKNKAIEDYLPYLAAAIFIGAAAFFLYKKRPGSNEE